MDGGDCRTAPAKPGLLNTNKTKVISADLLDFDLEDIIMFGNISVLVTLQFWWPFSFDKIQDLVTLQFW